MRDNAEVVKNERMTLWRGPSGGVVPHLLFVWGDVVNDDLPFSGKRTPDWSKRSLSLRQAGQDTN